MDRNLANVTASMVASSDGGKLFVSTVLEKSSWKVPARILECVKALLYSSWQVNIFNIVKHTRVDDCETEDSSTMRSRSYQNASSASFC